MAPRGHSASAGQGRGPRQARRSAAYRPRQGKERKGKKGKKGRKGKKGNKRKERKERKQKERAPNKRKERKERKQKESKERKERKGKKGKKGKEGKERKERKETKEKERKGKERKGRKERKTKAVVVSTGAPLSVDLRFALRDTAPGGEWFSALVEQKFSGVLARACRAARDDRDGKILAAAMGGRFVLGEGGRPVTARAAACGALAVSPDAWSFAVEPRTDYSFPAGLRRDGFRRPFPLEVQTLFPAELLQEARPSRTGGRGARAPQKAVRPVPSAPSVAKAPAKAQPSVQKAVAKKALHPAPAAAKRGGGPDPGGRSHVCQPFRLVKGKQAPKKRCAVACDLKRVRGVLVCAKCHRTKRAHARKTPKFKRRRCTDLGRRCKRSATAAACSICKYKPKH